MRISYLELKNYRRFKEFKLQFPDGIVGILGLNGAGKTTIIEAIAWALFGNVDEVVRTGKDSIRRTGAGPNDACAVWLEFELGGTEYRVEREMGGKSLSMRAVLRTKSRILAEDDKQVRKMVEKLIGMDHKSFFTSVFARQKELNALQNVAPGERKKVVLRMLRIDGLDGILTDIRADRKQALARIEGADRTLRTEDGREREAVLSEKLPELKSAFEEAAKKLSEAERDEKKAADAASELRMRRDELKKDVEAYLQTSGDLKAKRSAMEELRKREKSIGGRIADAKTRLQRLPALEMQDKEWSKVCSEKELLELEKSKSEKALMISNEIESDEKEERRFLEELQKLKERPGSAEELVAKIDDTERSRTESQTLRAEISGRLGELRNKVEERAESASRDREKLQEIKNAGAEGTCPTCERKLGDSYTLLVEKFSKSADDAEKAAKEASETITRLEGELKATASKEEALKKRRAAMDRDLAKLKQVEASIEIREKELGKVREKILQRKTALEQIGKVKFSQETHARLIVDYARLKVAHEQYIDLNSLRNQSQHYAQELDDVKDLMKRSSGEEQLLAGLVAQLEPKKALYELTLKELDQKTTALSASKDLARKLSSINEKCKSELERTQKDLVEIARVKKGIEEDRRKSEDLALLEEVVSNFKDRLMGRIAPALSELTSKELESMTGGKYATVELGEDYEMRIEDQGVMYPIDRFSGGEADLANLSLRLAISRIIADRTGANPINFLILDEIFGSQDPNRKRSVMTALSKLSNQFRQIFLITHIEDIKDTMSSIVRVEEHEDGTSTGELAS